MRRTTRIVIGVGLLTVVGVTVWRLFDGETASAAATMKPTISQPPADFAHSTGLPPANASPASVPPSFGGSVVSSQTAAITSLAAIVTEEGTPARAPSSPPAAPADEKESAPAEAESGVDVPTRPAEVLGTVRMIAAHASLRAPEVADPDSAANREILQAMIGKALLRSGAEVPPASHSN